MRRHRTPLRGSVTQNYVSARVRMRDADGISFLTRLAILAGLLAAFLIVVGISWYVGWPQQKAKEFQAFVLDLTKDAGLEIKDIAVEGRLQTSKDSLTDALRIRQGMPILAVDIDEAAERLEKLPWVDTVSVERRLPDIIAVTLTEHVPVARWQHNEKVSVIDGDGNVLASARTDDFSSLPMVVGTGAERAARAFLEMLNDYPDVRDKMVSAVRVSERRWDLRMKVPDDGAKAQVAVRLPEDDVANALRRLSVLMAEQKIINRNVVAVDLRIPDRLVVEPAVGEKKAAAKKKTGEKKKK